MQNKYYYDFDFFQLLPENLILIKIELKQKIEIMIFLQT